MTVFDWAHRILQNDTERLRTVAQRLHHAHLSDREEDLPK
jgi:sugar phosphate isomerase/epimerase